MFGPCIILSSSGFDKAERASLESLCSVLSHVLTLEHDNLTDRTNVLLCKTAGTPKYVEALRKGIPTVRYAWLLDSVRYRQLQPYDRCEYRVLCFLGIHVTVCGGSSQQRNRIRTLCESLGGIFTTSIQRTTHYLVNLGDSVPSQNEKVQFARRNKITITPAAWFMACAKEKTWIDPMTFSGEGALQSVLSPLQHVVALVIGKKEGLTQMVLHTGIRRVPILTPRTTHIVMCDAFGAIPSRDVRFMLQRECRCSGGQRKIVYWDWLEECFVKGYAVDEGPYRGEADIPPMVVVSLTGYRSQKRIEARNRVVQLGGVYQESLVFTGGGHVGLPTTHLVVAQPHGPVPSEKLRVGLERVGGGGGGSSLQIVTESWLERCAVVGEWVEPVEAERILRAVAAPQPSSPAEDEGGGHDAVDVTFLDKVPLMMHETMMNRESALPLPIPLSCGVSSVPPQRLPLYPQSMDLGAIPPLESQVVLVPPKDPAVVIPPSVVVSTTRRFLFRTVGTGAEAAAKRTLAEQTIKGLGHAVQVDDVRSATHVVLWRLVRAETALLAMAQGGKWMLRPEYLLESYAAQRWLPEQDFEYNELNAGVGQLDLAKACKVCRLRAPKATYDGWVAAVVSKDLQRAEVFCALVSAGGGVVMAFVAQHEPLPDIPGLTIVLYDEKSLDERVLARWRQVGGGASSVLHMRFEYLVWHLGVTNPGQVPRTDMFAEGYLASRKRGRND